MKISGEDKLEKVPFSISNVIPLYVELTAVATVIGAIAIPHLGVVWGLSATGVGSSLIKACFYDYRTTPIIQQNAYKSSIIYQNHLKEKSQIKNKTFSIIKFTALSFLGFKAINFIADLYQSKCLNDKEYCAILNYSYYFVVLGTIISASCLCYNSLCRS